MSTDPVVVPVESVESTASVAAAEPSAPPPSPVAADAPSAAAGSPTDDDGAPKRKLKLNPTIDPQVVRPRPNLSGAELPATAVASPAAVPEAVSQSAAAVEAAPSVSAPESPPEPPARRLSPVAIPRQAEMDSETEAELAAVMQGSEINAPAVAQPEEEGAAPVTEETLEPGAKLKGTIQSVDGENVFVDLGLRMTGVIPQRQFDPKRPAVVGAQVNVSVDKVDEGEGLILCNLPKGRGKVSGDWSSVVVGQTVECRVASVNKGGLEVTVGSLRGFLPASQVELGYAANLESYVGQSISARVTEVNPARRRLILSRRQLLAEEREVTSSQMLDEIHPGQVRNGVVKSLKDFGAFVDLGGIDGFLHVGQITWQRINKPSDVLSEGQAVEVKVLTVDREKKRISLSLRQMAANPWSGAESRYSKGTNLSGKVTRIEAFGAFVELEPGLEGMVHISELDHKRVARVEDVLSVGQMVDLQVLEVDPKKKRVSLSAKALKARPESTRPPKVKDEDLAPGKGEVYERKNKGNLKGGIGGPNAGGLFGDPRKFT